MHPYKALWFHKLRIQFCFLRPEVLPEFKGDRLRGLFGKALKQTLCTRIMEDGMPGCEVCECLYDAIMSNRAPARHPYARRFRTPPNPYVVEPPLIKRRHWEPGHLLTFHLVLIGPAADALWALLPVLANMAESGLGRQRANARLTAVDLLRPNGSYQPLFQSGRPLQLANRPALRLKDLPLPKISREVTLRFHTHQRIKKGDQWMADLAFPLLAERLAERAVTLSSIYCAGEWKEPAHLIRGARQVAIASHDFHWQAYRKQSGLKRQREPIGGYAGQITYQGDLNRFLPLLKIGEFIHVGKRTVYGLGQFQIISS